MVTAVAAPTGAAKPAGDARTARAAKPAVAWIDRRGLKCRGLGLRLGRLGFWRLGLGLGRLGFRRLEWVSGIRWFR
jgi:hypothetical protein